MSGQSDFHLKRVTQSQYRGGSTRLTQEEEDIFSVRDIPSIVVPSEEKQLLKQTIIEKTDVILTNVLPQEKIKQLKVSSYLEDIYKQVGL